MRISDWSSDLCSSDLHALDPRGGDVLLAELLQHEGARQAADVSETEVVEDGGRQDDVAGGVPEHVPSPGHGRIEHPDAGGVIYVAVIEEAEGDGGRHPANPWIHKSQAHEHEPKRAYGLGGR